jgi:hypothetical protein
MFIGGGLAAVRASGAVYAVDNGPVDPAAVDPADAAEVGAKTAPQTPGSNPSFSHI